MRYQPKRRHWRRRRIHLHPLRCGSWQSR
ncbi:hypothetical protein [Marivita sp.]